MLIRPQRYCMTLPMILKEADDRSADIAELRRLKSSSPPAFRAKIQKQIEQLYAGIDGEKQAAHFLKREFGRGENIAILHDLRLAVEGDYTQIDHLVIHRVQGAAWVLETKNYSGQLSCDAHGDWTVRYGGKFRAIPSPINQARRQCEALRIWLEINGVKAIRSVRPVVLISPTSSVDRSQIPPDIDVVKSDNFGAWWHAQVDAIGIGKALGMVGRHALIGLSPDHFRALGEQLICAHVPAAYDWRELLRLPRSREFDDQSDSTPAVVDEPSRDHPTIVTTPFGAVTIKRIPDGRFALRNDRNEALIELVKTACRGKGQWNPRFRNWLVDERELAGIIEVLVHGQDESDASALRIESDRRQLKPP